ncbi:glycosyltransferase family 2 protein [Paenibacillus sp. JMULE4]|uniref:glycosyltransferase family 2 protein n=1 Tax=Paenibacillus TaxID=44249 RepID=UPI002814D4C0|nr:glycosyltransferase family 2 protein [Paenibacillus sp. JMULE4]
MPTFNKASFIQQTLLSIYQQSYTQWRLLVIDDASTDRTPELVKSLLTTPRAKLVQNKVNRGIGHILNQALSMVNTKYFIQVDGDDWIAPDTLERLIHRMEKEPDSVALAYANTIHWHQIGGVDYYHKLVRHRPFRDRYDFAAYDPMVQPRFYRTACVRQVGGWEVDDPTQGRMMEDRRMLLRLLDRFTFAYVDRPLYHFRYHHSNLSLDSNAHVYNRLRKLYTDRALIRWGDLYTADYVGPEHLWQSVRLVPKRKGGSAI